MKADWLKRNAIVLVFLLVFLGLMAGAAWKLQQAREQSRGVKEELASQQNRLTELLRGKPFPSRDNVNTLKADREQVEKLYADLVQGARRKLEVPVYKRVEFAEKLAQKLSELNRLAKIKKVAVPDKFAFGFTAFLGVLPPADPNVLHLLTKELLVIERLSKLMMDADVYQLSQVRRVATGSEAGSSGGRDGGSDIIDGTIYTDPQGLYRTTPFEVHIECSTETLQKVINQLCELDWLILVRSVSIEARTVTVNVPGAPATTPRPVAPGPGMMPGMPPGFVPPPGPGLGGAAAAPEAPRTSEYNVLNVKVRLDLVELPEPAAPRGRTAAAAATPASTPAEGGK